MERIISLEGAFPDPREAENHEVGGSLPHTIWFNEDGDCKGVTGDGRRGHFPSMAWSIRATAVSDERSTACEAGYYQQTERKTADGAVVFVFRPDSVPSNALEPSY